MGWGPLENKKNKRIPKNIEKNTIKESCTKKGTTLHKMPLITLFYSPCRFLENPVLLKICKFFPWVPTQNFRWNRFGGSWLMLWHINEQKQRLLLYLNILKYLFICLSVHLSICPSVYLSICLSVYMSICPSVYLSICLSVYLSICLSFYLSICLSI